MTTLVFILSIFGIMLFFPFLWFILNFIFKIVILFTLFTLSLLGINSLFNRHIEKYKQKRLA